MVERTEFIGEETEMVKLFNLYVFKGTLDEFASHLKCAKCNKEKIETYKLYVSPDKEDNNVW